MFMLRKQNIIFRTVSREFNDYILLPTQKIL